MNRSSLILISPLFISLFIYVFYRSEQTLINQIINVVVSPNNLSQLQLKVQLLLPLPSIAIYSLPEGLWMLFVTQISKELTWEFKSRSYTLVILPLLIAILIEILQYLRITNGTFDLLDLILAILFWGLSIFLLPPHFNQLKISYKLNYRVLLFLGSYLIVILSDVI